MFGDTKYKLRTGNFSSTRMAHRAPRNTSMRSERSHRNTVRTLHQPPTHHLTSTSSPHLVPILYSPTSRAMPTALAHKPSILEPKCFSITQYIKILPHRNGTSTPMRIQTIICEKERNVQPSKLKRSPRLNSIQCRTNMYGKSLAYNTSDHLSRRLPPTMLHQVTIQPVRGVSE